jgi:hypothetical protein
LRRVHGRLVFLSCALTALATCNPYQHVGENSESLGPVDPVTFPPGNLGEDGDRLQPGQGSFVEIHAFAGDAPVGYFAYDLPAVKAGADPLRVLDDGKPYAAVPVPVAYAFDPAAGCRKPAGYKYDARRDDVHYDQQGNVFSALPKATYTPGVAVASSYVPVVQQIALSARSRDCQSLKSEDQVKAAFPGATAGARPTFLAWLVIDPGAAVHAFDAEEDDPGIGLQRWGWYNGYLLAYIDGGVVTTDDVEVMAGAATKTVVRMRPQKLYYPRVVLGTDAMGMPAMEDGARGAGYDVLETRLGDPGYSPLCQVLSYETPTPLAPEALPKNAATIMAMYGGTVQPGDVKYVYCLQARVVP